MEWFEQGRWEWEDVGEVDRGPGTFLLVAAAAAAVVLLAWLAGM